MPTNFDDKAQTWDDDPAKVARAVTVAAAIRDAVPLGPTTRLLEYGAGTALLAEQLADDVGAITLAEPSQGMRRMIERKIAAGALPGGTRVWDLDLAGQAAPDERFDLVASVLTLHHIPDLEPVLRGFAALLADGGHLCVVDLEREDGSFHRDDPAFEGHPGFDPDELATRLRAVGFGEVRFTRCGEVAKHDRAYPLFLATTAVGGR